MKRNGCFEDQVPERWGSLVVKSAQQQIFHGVVASNQPCLRFIDPGNVMVDIPGEDRCIESKHDRIEELERKGRQKEMFLDWPVGCNSRGKEVGD